MEQLSLDLPDDAEPKRAVTWWYHYTPKNLVEEVSGTSYVYGSWDHLFGCWVKKGAVRSAREVIPHWPMMDESGVWRGSEIAFRMRFPKTNVGRSQKWQRQERAAFIAYLSSIPRPIRSLVAPFGQYSWIMLDLIWQVPEFARFLDQEIRANDGQFVVAVVVLSEASRMSRRQRRDLAGRIMSTKRKSLINEVGPVSNTGRFIKLLRRLGNNYHGPEFYHELAAVMNCPRRSHFLSHEKNPKWEVVFGLTRIPDELLATPVIGLIGRSWRSYAILRNLNQMMEAAPSSVRSRTMDAFRSIRTTEDAWRIITRWEQRLLAYISFPASPLPDHNQLTPLSSPDAMRQEAHTMQNCLSDLIGDVVVGGVFYYHWDGPVPATVRVRNRDVVGGGQWHFADAAGVKNEKLPPTLIKYLKSLIKRLASSKPPVSGRQLPAGAQSIKVKRRHREKTYFFEPNMQEMKI